MGFVAHNVLEVVQWSKHNPVLFCNLGASFGCVCSSGLSWIGVCIYIYIYIFFVCVCDFSRIQVIGQDRAPWGCTCGGTDSTEDWQ